MITYIIQTSVCLLGFYLLYLLFLKRETFFSVNRWYLLGTLVASLVIPLLPALFIVREAPVFAASIEPVAITVQGLAQTFEKPAWYAFHWTDIVLMIYFLGVLAQSIRFLKGIQDIYTLYKNGQKSKMGSLVMVTTERPHLPFSFFHMLFLYKGYQLEGADLEKVIRHEQAHARQHHSIDVLIFELAGILLWMNPIIYFYRKFLREIHEYLADAAVLQTAPPGKYGRLLLMQRQSGLQMALTNQFFQSQLKNRIQMMTKKRSGHWARLKYLALLPVLLFTIALFSFRNGNQALLASGGEQANTAADTIPVTVQKHGKKTALEGIMVVGYGTRQSIARKLKDQNSANEKEPPLAEVDEMPRFAVCEDIQDQEKKVKCATEKLLQHIYMNIRYPMEARDAGIQGKVVAAFTVNEAGKVARTRIVKGLGYGTDQEVQRVIGTLNAKERPFIPAVKDGKAVAVELTIPVQFRLEDDHKEKKPGSGSWITLDLPQDEKPVYVLDGKQLDADGLTHLNPESIQSINVVKGPGQDEIEKYGEQARNGMIYITTKDAAMADKANNNEVFKVVEEMPRFPGCEDSGLEGNELTGCANGKLIEYIAGNLKYPEAARAQLIEGMVVAQFVVTKDGLVQEIEIMRSPGGGTGQAVVDVLESMNRMPEKWIPGRQRGKAVNVQMTIPVKFKLSSEETDQAKKRIDDLPVSLSLEGFQVSPNPSNGMFELSFRTASEGPVAIHVFDLNGAQVYSQLLETAAHTINTKIDLRKAISGNYILMVIQNGERFTTQIQKQ